MNKTIIILITKPELKKSKLVFPLCIFKNKNIEELYFTFGKPKKTVLQDLAVTSHMIQKYHTKNCIFLILFKKPTREQMSDQIFF